MNRTTPATRPDHHEGRPSMGKNRRLPSLVAVAGAALALAVGGIQPASADPDNGNPGTVYITDVLVDGLPVFFG